MADDKDNLGQDFKKAVAEMAKANKDLKAASAELEKSGAMAEAGEAITKQFKGFKQTLGNSIIGAMGPLGGVTEGLFKGFLSGKKQKKEEELLAKELGISVANMRESAQKKQLQDQEIEASQKLIDGAKAMGLSAEILERLEGDQKKLLIKSGRMKDDEADDAKDSADKLDKAGDSIDEGAKVLKEGGEVQKQAAKASIKTVQDFYKELRTDFVMPAAEALKIAKEKFEAQKIPEAPVLEAKAEVIPQEGMAGKEPDFVRKMREALERKDAERAKPEALPEIQPEAVAQDSLLDDSLTEQNIIVQKTQESIADFTKAALTAGSIFTHDKSVEDAIAAQAEQGGAAATELENEQRRKDEKLQSTLEGIEENTEGGGAKVKPQDSMGGGDAGKFGGIGKAIGGIGKGLGKGLGGILRGIAQGLIFWANPLVPLGAAALAAAIALIGAGIAGATWIVGKSLPTFAEGMKSFEDLDGEALIDAGKGMAAVAGGMAAFGVGTAVAGLGSLVGGITSGIVSLFGGDDPLTKMEKFQEYDFDEVRIKSNAEAMVAYGKGMAALGGAQAIAGVGAAVGAIGGAIAGLFGAEDPLDKMVKFQAYTFDTEKIKTNAAAVKAYAEAIKDFPTAPSASVFTAAKDAIIGLLGGDTDPFAPMKKFGELVLNEAGIKTNAGAVKAYAEAVKDFPSSPAASVFTAAKEAIIGLLGGNVDPFAPMKAFGDLVLNTEQIKTNAGAVKAYAEAMEGFPASPAAGVMTAAKNAVIDLLGGDTDPFAPMKAFGEVVLNVEQIKTNASAMVAYSTAMENMPAAPAAGVMAAAKTAIVDLLGGDTDPFAPLKKFGELVLNKEQIISNSAAVIAYNNAIKDMPAAPAASVLTAAKDAIIGLLGGKTDPFAPLKEFGDLKLDAAQIAINAEAVSAFGIAMENMPEVKGERAGGLLGAIGNFFGGEKKMPWDQVKAFAEADMGDAAKLKQNAESLTAFGVSLAGLSDIPTDIEDRLKGLGNGLEEFAKYIDDGEIETISQFADAMAKFPIGTFSGGAGKGGGAGTGGLASDLQLPLDVNDHYLHDRLDILTGQDFWRQVSLQNAAASAPTTRGDSMTVVNNTSMAGGQTTAVNTSIQTLVGTTDPHTQLAMAY